MKIIKVYSTKGEVGSRSATVDFLRTNKNGAYRTRSYTVREDTPSSCRLARILNKATSYTYRNSQYCLSGAYTEYLFYEPPQLSEADKLADSAISDIHNATRKLNEYLVITDDKVDYVQRVKSSIAILDKVKKALL